MTNGNESAYPIPNEQFGLTKREYFAAIAMQSIIDKDYLEKVNLIHFAKSSVFMADALIEQLNKQQ